MTKSRPVMVRIPWSHYVKKAEWGLTWAGIHYDTVDVGLKGMLEWEQFLPEGTVPVLRVDGELFADSHAILAWAEDVSGFAMYPTKAVRKWEAWADEEIGPVSRREAYRCLYATPGEYRSRWYVRAAARLSKSAILGVMKYYKSRRFDEYDAKAVPEFVEKICKQLGDKAFLFGDAPTAADFATAALMSPMMPIRNHAAARSPEWPQVQAYVARVKPAETLRERSHWQKSKDVREWRAFVASLES